MAANEIHLNDIGTIFTVTMMEDTAVVDLTGITTSELVFTKPDKSKVTQTGVVDANPATGIIRYTTVTGDLDQTGRWKWQAVVVIPGWEGSSDIGEFIVYGNL